MLGWELGRELGHHRGRSGALLLLLALVKQGWIKLRFINFVEWRRLTEARPFAKIMLPKVTLLVANSTGNIAIMIRSINSKETEWGIERNTCS